MLFRSRAWSDGAYEDRISSVAAVVLDASGTPVAAINVSGLNSSFEGEERRTRIGQAVADAGREISRQLGWCDGAPLRVVA